MSSDEAPISAKIAPGLMPEFEKLNHNQQKVVAYDSGPLLVLAGPGSGKTHCLALCALNLLLLGKAQPNEIILCTYTRKAAFEMQDRLMKMATNVGYSQDLSPIRVDTIHEICARFIRENAHRFPSLGDEMPLISRNFRTLDLLSQQLFIFNYLEEICGLYTRGLVTFWGSRWDAAKQLQKHFDKITEELIDLSALRAVEASQLLYVDEDARKKEAYLLRHLAECYQNYFQLLFGFDTIDFAHLQKIVFDLLGNSEAFQWITKDIKYVFVDEYQDTNYIQEHLLYRLTSETNNLCVVGDEDQSLYRFRGATVQNIGDFYGKFPHGFIRLTTNYRTHAKIIDIYNNRINSIPWGIYHSKKKMKPLHEDIEQYPAVCSISGTNKEDEARQMADLVVFLKEQGKITGYDQVALLLHSVKPELSEAYIAALKEKRVPVFCSRARAYFKQEEVCLLVGCFARIFHYVGGVETEVVGENDFEMFINNCCNLLAKVCKASDLLEELLQNLEVELLRISQGEDLAKRLPDYFYALLAVEPFKSFLEDEQKAYNLGKFSRFMEIFENFNQYDSLAMDNLAEIASSFFNQFLCLLLKDGDNESEDRVIAFPEGYLPIMTIHQAKGLEFPVVIVGGLDRTISSVVKVDVNSRLRQFCPRQSREPENQIPTFDYMRLFYVAFSRAMNMLILTGNQRRKPATAYLRKLKDELPVWPYMQGDLLSAAPFHCRAVPIVRPRHSFTSIRMYETCPRMYQYHREFKFVPSRPGEFFFGLLVHQTIEGIHRMVLDGQIGVIYESQVRTLFEQTYYALSHGNLRSLSANQKDKAFEQVMNYYENNLPDMQYITQAEEQVSVVNDEYTLTGTIDLVLERDQVLEIMDLKTARRPDLDTMSLEYYERQLRIYAHALERRDNRRPDRLLLYWTEQPHKKDAMMVIPYDREKIAQDVMGFKAVVMKIKNKQFTVTKIPERHICLKCDMRYLCVREDLIQPFS